MGVADEWEQQRRGTPPSVGTAGPPEPTAAGPPPRTSFLLLSKGGAKLPPGTARPMTSHKPAGYSGAASPTAVGRRGSGVLSTATTDEQCAELEDRVHALLEQSAASAEAGDAGGAVSAAREAARAENRLCGLRRAAGQADLVSLSLKYAVGVNLASAYASAGQAEEALRAYEDIIACGLFPQAGWLRLNMGNIHCQQQQYAAAVKCYRMALDAMPPGPFRRLRLDTMRNMGVALWSAGRVREAFEVLRTIMQEGADHQAAFNLVLCAAALQDAAALREALSQLLAVPLYVREEDEEEGGGASLSGAGKAEEGAEPEALQQHLAAKQAQAERLVLQATRLAAPLLGEEDWAAGFDWCTEQLAEAGYGRLAEELVVVKAVEQVWERRGAEVPATLRKLAQRCAVALGGVQAPGAAVATAALCHLEGVVAAAEGIGGVSLVHTAQRLPASSPAPQGVAEGNSLLVTGQASQALVCYEGAMRAAAETSREAAVQRAAGSKEMGGEHDASSATRLQPVYNAGLAARQAGQGSRAAQLFGRVLQTAPAHVEAMLQVAELCEESGDTAGAVGWLTRLLAAAPHDAGVLARLGALQARMGDDGAALTSYLEAFRADPTCIDTLSWLGARAVRGQDYAAAIPYFQAATRAQPRDLKWPLMVAGCLRRVGDVGGALGLYQDILARDPCNAEAARYLAQLGAAGGEGEEAAS